MLFKRLVKVFKFLLLFTAILFALVLVTVNFPVSQRLITEKANGFFREKNLPVQVGRVTLLVNGKIGLSHVQIIKNSEDTLVFASRIKSSVRIIPLIIKKLKVKSIIISDAAVYISTDSITGSPDIVSMFSQMGNKQEQDTIKRAGKKWDISVNTVNLKNIRFSYNDAFNGIRISETIGKLLVRFDEFSLIRQQLFIALIELEKAYGGVTIWGSSVTKDPAEKPASSWNFKLSRSDLRDIKFSLEQPDANQRYEFSLGLGDISGAGFDPGNHDISVASLVLTDPAVNLFSSPSEKRTGPVSENNTGINFPGSWKIAGDNVKISNGSFRTNGYNSAITGEPESSFLQVASLSTAIKDLVMSSTESGFNMNRFSFALENGFSLDKSEIIFKSDSTKISRLEANLKTSSSRIKFKIEAGSEIAQLINSWRSVPFSLEIDDTEISADDILSFLPGLKENTLFKTQKDLSLGIKTVADGTADLLKIGNFSLKTSSGITFLLSGQVANLTKLQSSECSVDFSVGPITSAGLNELVRLSGPASKLPDFEPVTIQGRIDSSLVSPEFNIKIQSGSGNIDLNGAMGLRGKSYDLRIVFSGLELGKLSGISDMNEINGSLDLAGAGFAPARMKIKTSLRIDSAVFREYNYQDILTELEGDNGLYKFEFNSPDQFFKFDLEGIFSRNDSTSKAEISGLFGMDAGKLNLFRDLSLSGYLEGNILQSTGNLNASVFFKNLKVTKADDAEGIENLSLSFHSSDTLVKGGIESDFLMADFYSAGSIADLKRVLTEGGFRMTSLMDSAAGKKVPYISVMPETSVSIESTWHPIIGLFVNDSVFSYNKVAIHIKKDTSDIARSDITVDRFNIGMNRGFGATVNLENLPDKTNFVVRADSIRSGNISLAWLSVDVSATKDTAFLSLDAKDRNGRLLYGLAGTAYKNERQIKLKTTQPEWVVNSINWTIAPGEFLILEPDKKDFSADMHLKNDQRAIDIYGRRSEKIWLELRNVWLSMLTIPGMNTIGYDGELTGKIDYQGKDTNELGIHMDLSQMKIKEALLGQMKINGRYLSDTIGNVESNLSATINDTSSLTLRLRSVKNPDQKNITTEFSGIPLNILEPLVGKYVSGLHGEVDGGLILASKGKKPVMNGEIRLSNTGLRVVPLNALFYLPDNVIRLENNQFVFSQFTVLDSLNKKLNLTGTISLNPDNIIADLLVTSDLLQVMNTTEKDNESFNGSVFVNSKLKITGPVQKPAIEGSIVLAEGTVINYQYAENLTVSETQKVITFAGLIQDQDTTDIKKDPVNQLSRSPDIEASIEIDPKSLFNFKISRGFDIGARITGGGFLTYSIMPNGEMDLTGTYEINQGSSELKIPGWPRKDFIITPGSYLKWDGKVDDPELQVETTSKVRGSYMNPVDGKNREVDFLVYMKIAEKLSQLEIIFDVRSADQYITSVFNSLSTDERMRQAINLLIFGSIQLPNLESSSDYMSQQISQFWESQLNQITKSAIKSVDVSFGVDTYTGATESGGEQTYTSLSYQVKKDMFNDRGSVLVSGHMNDGSPASQQSNNVIENFIFEYALDTNRSKFLKVYRQQNYEDLLEGEVTKSGVGFIYRRNYDKLSDIWRRKKKTKNK